MSRIHLVVGGTRSGKSAHALRLARSLPAPHTFVATCQAADAEMQQRVARHQREREADIAAGTRWRTIESPLELAAALRPVTRGTVLVDCLTLWVSNLLGAAHDAARELTETEVEQRCREVIAACAASAVLFVSSEVGLGIVPASPVARRYADLLGRCNQTIAAHAAAVTLVCCGVPLNLRGEVTA